MTGLADDRPSTPGGNMTETDTLRVRIPDCAEFTAEAVTAMAGQQVRLLAAPHDWQAPVGRATVVAADRDGVDLLLTLRPDTDRQREAFAAVLLDPEDPEDLPVAGCGYEIRAARTNSDGTRALLLVGLFEVSPVAWPPGVPEERDLAASQAWSQFNHRTPEAFWDVSVWRDGAWVTGSMDVADRKRITLAGMTQRLTPAGMSADDGLVTCPECRSTFEADGTVVAPAPPEEPGQNGVQVLFTAASPSAPWRFHEEYPLTDAEAEARAQYAAALDYGFVAEHVRVVAVRPLPEATS